jgi:hypothetical protein
MVTDSAQHAGLTQSCRLRTCGPDSVSGSAPEGPVSGAPRLSPSIGSGCISSGGGCAGAAAGSGPGRIYCYGRLRCPRPRRSPLARSNQGQVGATVHRMGLVPLCAPGAASAEKVPLWSCRQPLPCARNEELSVVRANAPPQSGRSYAPRRRFKS